MKGDLVTDSHSILARWRNHFSHLSKVHVVMMLGRQKYMQQNHHNQQEFFTNAHIHGFDTRNKNHLHLPAPSLSCVQKGVSCSGVKICNGLPGNIQNYKGDRRKFKKELHKYLTVHSFYSITEFLEWRTNKRNVLRINTFIITEYLMVNVIY